MKVLFVCLGNICRSPAAEGVFAKMVEDAGLEEQITIDSAGTAAYHTGEEADGRMQAHAQSRGYKLTSLARKFQSQDFSTFDYIITMDNSNYENVKALSDNDAQLDRLHKMVSFCRVHDVPEVPDPYYKGDDGFRLVMDILEDGCSQLLLHIQKHDLGGH